MKPPRWPCQDTLGIRERDEHVQAQPDQQGADVAADLLRHHQQRADQPEDRAGRTQRGRVLVGQPVDQRGAGQQGDEVEREEPGPAEHRLELRPEEPQRQHVEADVPELDVREAAGHQLPVGALADPVDPAAVTVGRALQSPLGAIAEVEAAGLVQALAATGGQQRQPVGQRAVLPAGGQRSPARPRRWSRSGRSRSRPGWRCACRRTASARCGSVFAPSATQDGHWNPTAASRMQSGQIGRSQRWQRM